MKSKEIRETYLSFFEGKGHARVPSAPVVYVKNPVRSKCSLTGSNMRS